MVLVILRHELNSAFTSKDRKDRKDSKDGVIENTSDLDGIKLESTNTIDVKKSVDEKELDPILVEGDVLYHEQQQEIVRIHV